MAANNGVSKFFRGLTSFMEGSSNPNLAHSAAVYQALVYAQEGLSRAEHKLAVEIAVPKKTTTEQEQWGSSRWALIHDWLVKQSFSFIGDKSPGGEVIYYRFEKDDEYPRLLINLYNWRGAPGLIFYGPKDEVESFARRVNQICNEPEPTNVAPPFITETL